MEQETLPADGLRLRPREPGGRAARGDCDAGTADPAKRRARKLWRFFAQPFFVAEPYTGRSGAFVSRAEAFRGCREILDGLHDDLPDEAFYFTGGIDEIRARAVKPVA